MSHLKPCVYFRVVVKKGLESFYFDSKILFQQEAPAANLLMNHNAQKSSTDYVKSLMN